MINKSKVSDTYCVLPFNHMNFHPNGNVSVCCVSQMYPPDSGFYKDEHNDMLNLKDQTINDMWNSASLQIIRKEMLEGKKPACCSGCYDIEANGGISRRLNENKRWKNITKPKVEFLDLRVSNLCNLKCLMCYPDSSSALMSDYKEWTKKYDFIIDNPCDKELFQWFNEEAIEQLLVHKKDFKYLYINGGEPFIMPLQWKFLERLIEEGVSNNIKLSYNTNCTTYDEKFSDYWKYFKEVRLGLSVDAVGDKNKFIRHPSNWETTNRNVLNLINNKFISHINITCSIQWLNAPFLEEFYDWAVPIISKKKYYSINQNFVVFPYYLSLNCTSKKFKDNLLNLYTKSKHSNRILSKTMLSYLKVIPDNNELWDQGIKYMDLVEQYRSMKWREVFDYEYC